MDFELNFETALFAGLFLVIIAVSFLLVDIMQVGTGSTDETPVNFDSNGTYTMEEVSQHNVTGKNPDCWVVVRDNVYNFTGFLGEHPVGAGPIECGQNNTNVFMGVHGDAIESLSDDLMEDRSLNDYMIGQIKD